MSIDFSFYGFLKNKWKPALEFPVTRHEPGRDSAIFNSQRRDLKIRRFAAAISASAAMLHGISLSARRTDGGGPHLFTAELFGFNADALHAEYGMPRLFYLVHEKIMILFLLCLEFKKPAVDLGPFF